jgi:NADPH:quinone reductase-like Zn-dependent oxidoreductase
MELNDYDVLEMESFGGGLTVKKRTLKEKLEDEECLIKVHVTTIHPADMFFLGGHYGHIKPKIFPLVPGFEGSGEIIKVGEKVDRSNIGKRVCLVQNSLTEGPFQGMWGQYTYAPFKSLMVFNDKIPYERIAFSIVNPLTVCGFVDTIRKAKSKAVVQTAAFSSVGKMLIRICAKEKDIKTINLVRKSEQVNLLKEIGADHVINTSDENWEVQLKEISQELDAKVCFECVGGDLGSKILSAMPNGSTLFHYGNLTFKPLGGFTSGDLIFMNKKIQGWWLGTWLTEVSEAEKLYWFAYIVTLMYQDSDVFKTSSSKSYGLGEIDKAIEDYLSNMSGGKSLILPNN